MNDLSIGEILKTLLNIIQAYIQRIAALTQLATLEAKLALKTLLIITVLLFVLSIIFLSTWFSLLFLCYQWLSEYFSPIISATCIVGINVFVLLLIVGTILKIKKNLFFPTTRSHLQQFNPKHEELLDENLTPKN